MMLKLNIEDEKSFGKAVLFLLLGSGLSLLCFAGMSLLAFGLIHFFIQGTESESMRLLNLGILKLQENPLALAQLYKHWWQTLIVSIRTLSPAWFLFIPFAAPLSSFGVLYAAFSRSSYSFSLWYILRHHFAKLEDVSRMGLIKGSLLVLGRFEGHILGLGHPATVLCLGETGCGKTTTVSIPSILRSDNNSVLAMDNTGALARYTSGYRSRLGPVFYFNWDLSDDEDKGAFYPRWNPLAEGNLPLNGAKRDEYIKFLASQIVSGGVQTAKDSYWDWLAADALGAFIGFMAAKCGQATANDYFLNEIIEKGKLTKDDKDTLLSYYALMPAVYAQKAIKDISQERLEVDDYFPVGSWEGIPAAWQGKDLCLGMITDWLLKNYLKSKDDNGNDDWRHWLEQLLTEASLFGYGAEVLRGLQQFLYLSKQQRQLVFAYVLKPLRGFLHQTLRERTGSTDLRMADLRGVVNRDTQKLEPITIYTAANTKTSKFVSRLFIEMLMRYGVLQEGEANRLPILLVADDAGQMMRIGGLTDCVAKGPAQKTSVLLICNSLVAMERIYGRETVENLVANSNYKIIMADTSSKLSRQMNKLAVFATSSVQIPQDKKKIFHSQKQVANSNYYHRLARYLRVRKDLRIETKGYQLLLVEGYYHRPVLTSNIHFLRDGKFRDKAMLDADYFVDLKIKNRRNNQDSKVPTVENALAGMELGLDDEMELAQYMNVVYDEAKSKQPEDDKMESVMINDISEKWNRIPMTASNSDNQPNNEWWLDEKAFDSAIESASQNPFAAKK